MSENYQVGELVRADVVIHGKVERVLLTYIPDDTDDGVPWRRLVPNADEAGGWHTTDDLANIERMVAVPVIGRDQIRSLVDYWFNEHEANPSIGHDEMIVDGVIALLGLPK